MTPSSNPQDGYYVEEVWNVNYVQNVKDVCTELYDNAFEDPYARIDDIVTYNELKVLDAFRSEKFSDTHMGSTLDADGQQALGHIVHALIELAPCKSEVTVRIDDILLIRSHLGPVFQPVAEGSV